MKRKAQVFIRDTHKNIRSLLSLTIKIKFHNTGIILLILEAPVEQVDHHLQGPFQSTVLDTFSTLVPAFLSYSAATANHTFSLWFCTSCCCRNYLRVVGTFALRIGFVKTYPFQLPIVFHHRCLRQQKFASELLLLCNFFVY